mmetsp:Transcript_8868/g.10883  ORF Transcript_8868/g.10883 Transcript_8868/m.10883 type:complete len:120 (+) Transcript_8868:428-787(+)
MLAENLLPPGADFIKFVTDLFTKADGQTERKESLVTDTLALEAKNFAEQVTREVNDCKMAHVVRKSMAPRKMPEHMRPKPKVTHTFSKLAAIIVRFKVIGEPNYPDTVFEYSYADMNPE